MGLLDRLSPGQKKALMYGVPLAAAAALGARYARGGTSAPSTPSEEPTTVTATTATLPQGQLPGGYFGTDVLGVGQLADFESVIAGQLAKLQQVISDRLPAPTTPTTPTTPAPAKKLGPLARLQAATTPAQRAQLRVLTPAQIAELRAIGGGTLMASITAEQVAKAAAAAGFAGDALVRIVAIAKRESGYNPEAQGDLGLQDATWGPSVGLYQIRTLKAQTGTGGDRDLAALIPGAIAGQAGTGHGDVTRQSAAAFAISGGGTNFKPWTANRAITAADLDDARRATAGKDTAPAISLGGETTPGAGLIPGTGLAGLVDLTTGGIADLLGVDDLIAEVFVIVVSGIFVIAAFFILVTGLERVTGAKLRARVSDLTDAASLAGTAAAAA